MPRLYDTARWKKARALFLREHPHCKRCAARGKQTVAVAVDHIQRHDNDPELFFDESNWQGLCVSCHSEKTSQRDGGFGNKLKERHDPIKMKGCGADGIPFDKNHHWHKR
jgi:5-methylcytosine-specific restriction enzyme A